MSFYGFACRKTKRSERMDAKICSANTSLPLTRVVMAALFKAPLSGVCSDSEEMNLSRCVNEKDLVK
jgi:hypothetical protein